MIVFTNIPQMCATTCSLLALKAPYAGLSQDSIHVDIFSIRRPVELYIVSQAISIIAFSLPKIVATLFLHRILPACKWKRWLWFCLVTGQILSGAVDAALYIIDCLPFETLYSSPTLMTECLSIAGIVDSRSLIRGEHPSICWDVLMRGLL